MAFGCAAGTMQTPPAMEEDTEFIDEKRDSLAGRGPDPGWEPVRFDVEDEPAAEEENDAGR